MSKIHQKSEQAFILTVCNTDIYKAKNAWK